MLSFSVPPGYRRRAEIKRPKLDGFTEIIEQWLLEDVPRWRKGSFAHRLVYSRTSDGGKKPFDHALFSATAFAPGGPA